VGLKIGQWNLNGITEINSYFKKRIITGLDYDIVCLSETHLRDNQEFNVDGYTSFLHNREYIHRNAVKGSGGVAVLVKDNLFSEYNVGIIARYEGILGLKLCHKKSEFTSVIFSCYLPPESSIWGRDSNSFFSTSDQ
jgi:exonuclease III